MRAALPASTLITADNVSLGTQVDRNTTVRVDHHFRVPAERVFDAWLDPKSARKWLFTAPGRQITRCEIDARAGGQFVIVDRRGDESIEHVGEYVEIRRPTRLVFTFAVPKYSPQITRVTIDIVVESSAGCELTLTHEGVLLEWRGQTEEGWKMILANLEGTLT
jgi:uncharacterized protein YndB with AHSA1/START domain